mmetsp:Transcript_9723/g.17685  ORF Transcript_9723/g.17685 Transcript_9723/m.17685 type:complete len:1078 (-) Transcript_9723:103-3336(-)
MSAVAAAGATGIQDATRTPVFQTRLCVGERIRWVRVPVQSIDPNASPSNVDSIWWPALLYKNHEELLEDLTDESSQANKKLAAIQYHHFKTKQDAGGDPIPPVARLILSSDSSRMKLKIVKHNVLPPEESTILRNNRNPTGTCTKSVRNFYNCLVRITCHSSSRFHPLFREGFDNAIHLLQYYEEHAAMSEIIPLSPDDDDKEDDIPLIPSSRRMPILDRTTRPKMASSSSSYSGKKSKKKRTDTAIHVPEERDNGDAGSHVKGAAANTETRLNEKKSQRQQASLTSHEESDEDSFESNHDDEEDEESDDSSNDELIEMNLGTPVKLHENWPSVWAKMRQHGKWKWKLGSGLMTDYYYIKPQGAIKGGNEGIDFFTSEDACKEYVRNTFGWVGDDKDKENSKMTMKLSSAKRKRRSSKKFDQTQQHQQEKAESKKTKQQKKQEKKRKPTSSPPDSIDVKVQKKNGLNRFSASSSNSSLSSSQSSLKEEEDPYLFQVLWPNLESAGWTVVKAGRWNPLDDWYYIQPGKSVENGQLGIDYFRSIEDVIQYQKTLDGAKGKKKRRESMDSATPTRPTQPRDPGLPYQTSDEESAAASAESSVTDPYSWGVLKPRLIKAGWKIVKATKWNRLHNWYYIHPQKSVENGQLGVDYFCEQSHVMDYQRQLDALEANGEAAVKRSALLDSFEDEAAAAATERAKNDPLEKTIDWWRTEIVPSFSDVWEILRKVGFDYRSGRYVLPGRSVKDAEGVHVFNRASEIQRRLCKVGIQSVLSPGKFVIGKDLGDDEWYDIARWISVAIIPRISDLQRSSVLESIPTLTSMDVWDLLQSKAGFYEQDGTFYRSGVGDSSTAKPLMEGTNYVSTLAELRQFIARHGLQPLEESPSGRRSSSKKLEQLETGLTSTDTTAICLWAAHVTVGKNRPSTNTIAQNQQQQIPQDSTHETAAIVDSSPNSNEIVDVQEEKERQPTDPQDTIVQANIALTPSVVTAGEKLDSNDQPIVTAQKHVSTISESENLHGVSKSVAFTPGMNSDEKTKTSNYGAVIVTEQKAAFSQDLDNENEEGHGQGMYLTQPISSDSQFS